MRHWKWLMAPALMVFLTMAVSISCGDDDDDDDDDAGDDDVDDDADDDSDDDADDDAGEFSFGSSAFNDGDRMPDEYACGQAKGGNGVSPPLEWSNPPEGTVAWAITMFDPEADDFGHWGIANIPVGTMSLEEAISPGGVLPEGAFEVMNDFGNEEYDGPCPPEDDGDHTYEITIWALGDQLPATPPDEKAGWCIHALYSQLIMVAIVYAVITVTYSR